MSQQIFIGKENMFYFQATLIIKIIVGVLSNKKINDFLSPVLKDSCVQHKHRGHKSKTHQYERVLRRYKVREKFLTVRGVCLLFIAFNHVRV